MSTFLNWLRSVKGGVVLIDPNAATVLLVIALQYNSETLTRTLALKGIQESGDRSEVLRWKEQLAAAVKLGPKVNPVNQCRAPMQLPRGGNR